MLDEIQKCISAKLPRRLPEDSSSDAPSNLGDKVWEDEVIKENGFDWNPHKEYFRDEVDPRRIRLDKYLDYNCKTDVYGNVTFNSNQVHWRFRRLIIANQMHRCCFTCWKYINEGQALICRFAFPWLSTPITEPDTPKIHKDRDKKARLRVRAFPSRNNANINPFYAQPYMTLVHGGNVDIQWISNDVGAAEYAASYASKQDEADLKLVRKIVIRRYAYFLIFNIQHSYSAMFKMLWGC